MFYIAKVKVETEGTDKKGMPTVITSNVQLVVKGVSQGDVEVQVYEYFEGLMATIRITSVAESKIEAIIDNTPEGDSAE